MAMRRATPTMFWRAGAGAIIAALWTITGAASALAQAAPDVCATTPEVCWPQGAVGDAATPAPIDAPAPTPDALYSTDRAEAARALDALLAAQSTPDGCAALGRFVLDVQQRDDRDHLNMARRVLDEGRDACVVGIAQAALPSRALNPQAQRALIRLTSPRDRELELLSALQQGVDATLLSASLKGQLSAPTRGALVDLYHASQHGVRLHTGRALEHHLSPEAMLKLISGASLPINTPCSERVALTSSRALDEAAARATGRAQEQQLMSFAYNLTRTRHCLPARTRGVELMAIRLARGGEAEQPAWAVLLRVLRQQHASEIRATARGVFLAQGQCFASYPGGDPPAMVGVLTRLDIPTCKAELAARPAPAEQIVRKNDRRARRKSRRRGGQQSALTPTLGVSIAIPMRHGDEARGPLTVPIWLGANYYPHLRPGWNAFVSGGAYLDLHKVGDDTWMDVTPVMRAGVSLMDNPRHEWTDRAFPWVSVYGLAGYRAFSQTRAPVARVGVGVSSAWTTLVTLYAAAYGAPLPLPGIIEGVVDYNPVSGRRDYILMLGLGF